MIDILFALLLVSHTCMAKTLEAIDEPKETIIHEENNVVANKSDDSLKKSDIGALNNPNGTLNLNEPNASVAENDDSIKPSDIEPVDGSNETLIQIEQNAAANKNNNSFKSVDMEASDNPISSDIGFNNTKGVEDDDSSHDKQHNFKGYPVVMGGTNYPKEVFNKKGIYVGPDHSDETFNYDSSEEDDWHSLPNYDEEYSK